MNKHTYICSRHFVGGAGSTQEYPDPISALQVGSQTPVITQSCKLPPRRLLSDTAANIVNHEQGYASFSTSVNAVTTEISTDDLMDISLDEENTPISISADSSTQVSAAAVNVATQIKPVTMVDASTQTDRNGDRSKKKKNN